MKITTIQYQGRVQVALLRLAGKLDGTSYLELIGRAKKLYVNGTRHMILDLAQLTHLTSAGMLALHQIAVLLRGETPADPEEGWTAFHALADDLDRSIQSQLKLLAPAPQVLQVLERAGLTALFEIVTDLDTTLAGFSPASAKPSQPTRPSPRYLRALNWAARTPRPTPTPEPC